MVDVACQVNENTRNTFGNHLTTPTPSPLPSVSELVARGSLDATSCAFTIVCTLVIVLIPAARCDSLMMIDNFRHQWLYVLYSEMCPFMHLTPV